MREVGVEELVRSTDDPFVRHQVDPVGVRAAWVAAGAVVISGTRGRPGETPPGPVFTCLGSLEDLGPLMRAVAARSERLPWRLTVEVDALDAVPEAWRHERHHRWHWILTRGPVTKVQHSVVEVDDADEINGLLDEANPDSFARPGVQGIEAWLGVRNGAGPAGPDLVAVGALMRQADGTGHLRGVSVHPAAAGRGLGRSVSAALTGRALATGSGVATLGVYVDNAAAVAMYARLGYRTAHTFASGPVNRSR